MKSVRKRFSYANVMSSIAVFLVLGGGAAIAAGNLAKNSVGTKQLKRNAVTGSKIKKNAVSTAKIKNKAVTGAKINLSSIGTVPNASHASTADSASTAVSAGSADNFLRFFASGLKKAGVGQTVPLLTIGPFAIVGKCVDLGASSVSATTWLTTNQPGSSMYSYGDTSHYESNFNPGTEVEIGYEAHNNNPSIAWDNGGGYYTGFHAASGDGATLLEGDAVNGVLVYGSQCAFWVSATNVG